MAFYLVCAVLNTANAQDILLQYGGPNSNGNGILQQRDASISASSTLMRINCLKPANYCGKGLAFTGNGTTGSLPDTNLSAAVDFIFGPAHGSQGYATVNTLNFMARTTMGGPRNIKVLTKLNGGAWQTMTTFQLTPTATVCDTLSAYRLVSINTPRCGNDRLRVRLIFYGGQNGFAVTRLDSVQINGNVVITPTRPAALTSTSDTASVADTNICGSNLIFLNVRRKGLGNGQWKVDSGGHANDFFQDVTNPNSLFRIDPLLPRPLVYKLSYSVTDAGCRDIVYQYVRFDKDLPAPLISSPDKLDSLRCDTVVNLVANSISPTEGFGVWQLFGKDPQDTTRYFADSLNPITTFTGRSGNLKPYRIRWVFKNKACETLPDQVNLRFYPRVIPPTPADSFRCGPGQVALRTSGSQNGTFRWYKRLPNGTIQPIPNQYRNTILTDNLAATDTLLVSIMGQFCESAKSIAVANVYPIPVCTITPDTVITIGDSINLTATGGIYYHWYPSTGLSDTNTATVNAKPTISTTYYVDIINDKGCGPVRPLKVFIKVIPKFRIPSAFTPNGDGKNDVWNLISIENYPNATIEVFNRNGSPIYDNMRLFSKPWDGTYNGAAVPMGVYTYIIDLNNGTGKYTGQVTVIR